MKTYNSNFISVKPISINSVFQGRRFKTTEFKKWQMAVINKLPEGESMKKKFSVLIRIYLKEPSRSDIDNFLKPLIDCIVYKGIIPDDRYIIHLEAIKKHCEKEEGFEVEINEIE